MAYFTGKQAVITGAGSGIGRALALQLNSDGCHLWISDVNEEGLAETVSLIRNTQPACHSRRLDVADRVSVHQLADDIADDVGHVDLVINNAGVGYGATVEETELGWIVTVPTLMFVLPPRPGFGTRVFVPAGDEGALALLEPVELPGLAPPEGG